MKKYWSLVVFLALLGGCNQAPADNSSAGGSTSDSTASTGSTGTSGQTPNDPEKETAPERSAIPASVKTDGYAYYGFDSETSPTYEFLGSPSGPATGSYEMKLVKVTEDSAVFRQTWKEGLSTLPVTEYVVKADGVYASKLGEKELNPPQLELLASPEAGKTWTSNKLELPGATVTSSSVKVIGIEKTKTRMGTYDALVVKATVKATMSDKPLSMEMTAYYAKGIGPIKIKMEGKGVDGKPAVTTLEAIKK
jgi:hypothetical protein